MFDRLLKSVFGSKHERDLKRVFPIVDEINRLVEEYRALSEDALSAKTGEFRARLAEATRDVADLEERRRSERETLDELLPDAFGEGWGRATSAWAPRWAAASRGWIRRSGGSSTPATSPTEPTTSSASTTCATTWRCVPSSACSAASLTRSSTRWTRC